MSSKGPRGRNSESKERSKSSKEFKDIYKALDRARSFKRELTRVIDQYSSPQVEASSHHDITLQSTGQGFFQVVNQQLATSSGRPKMDVETPRKSMTPTEQIISRGEHYLDSDKKLRASPHKLHKTGKTSEHSVIMDALNATMLQSIRLKENICKYWINCSGGYSSRG